MACAVQVTLYPSHLLSGNRPVVTWSLPAMIVPVGVEDDDDPIIQDDVVEDEDDDDEKKEGLEVPTQQRRRRRGWDDVYPAKEYECIILHGRVARALGIPPKGGELVFRFDGSDERHLLPTSSDDNAPFDMAILADTERIPLLDDFVMVPPPAKAGSKLLFSSSCNTVGGTIQYKVDCLAQDWLKPPHLNIPPDTMGMGMLQFDGAILNHDKNYIGGAGFSVCSSTIKSITDPSPVKTSVLVKGYRYLGGPCSRHRAAYCGIIEGLEIALRFDFKTLWIMGGQHTPAQLVVQQLEVRNCEEAKLKSLFDRAMHLCERARIERGTQLRFKCIDTNVDAKNLAERAVDERRNETTCFWRNIHRQCRR